MKHETELFWFCPLQRKIDRTLAHSFLSFGFNTACTYILEIYSLVSENWSPWVWSNVKKKATRKSCAIIYCIFISYSFVSISSYFAIKSNPRLKIDGFKVFLVSHEKKETFVEVKSSPTSLGTIYRFLFHLIISQRVCWAKN